LQILDAWMRDIPQQFQGKHNIEVLFEAFARQLQELQQVFDDMSTKLDLDTATGKNLDYVGTIIPLSRKEAGELAGIGVTDPVISDERYRQFLRYKNLVNTNECTYYDLMEGLSLLWDVSPIYYVEDPAMPATIILTMPFLKPGGEVVRLGEVPMVKPAGVSIEFQYSIKVAVEVTCNFINLTYAAPKCGTIKCGTYPDDGTVGKILYVEMNTDIETLKVAFENQKTGTVRVGGVLYDATLGEFITDDVEIEINSDLQIEELSLTGQVITGTQPVQAVSGVLLTNSTVTDSSSATVKASLTRSGTKKCGE